MKIIIFHIALLYCVLYSFHSHAQQTIFTKKWDTRLGGNLHDYCPVFQKTKDGGFILGGFSNSYNKGDKSDTSRGGFDYWIVKIDSMGNKKWDKTFGGSGSDYLFAIQATSENGYILGGSSSSGITGDKTEASRGNNDFWIVKIDSVGNKQWDKTLGGSRSDNLYALKQTNDGGYILGGFSNSGISGDKSEDNWDTTYFYDDFWIVKIDKHGNKQWDKRFGGTDQDGLSSLFQTGDGGYLLGGISASDSSGDKTQPAWGFQVRAYWIVKIDSLGNKQWDKRYGGTSGEILYDVKQTNDKGFILGGYSYSPVSGDKSQSTLGYWIVKTDSLGNKQWDKAYGGVTMAELYSVSQTQDYGYLLCGRTSSNQGGDKTENNLGSFQTWIIKTDTSGNKMWDKTILTTGFDGYGFAIETCSQCYVIANSTNGDAGGYVTEPNRGVTDSTYDYWIAKFCWEIPNATAILPEAGVTVYPNPFSTDLAIALQKENLQQATFTISNLQGQIIFRQEESNLANAYIKMLDFSYLPAGVYLVEVVADGDKVVKKVVKQ